MKHNALLLLGYIFFWFLIDYVFQISANRSFTFVDDHTIISTHDFISNFGKLDYLKEVLLDKERFRPMMGINRLFFVSVFKTDICAISYYFLFLGGITGFFLHQFAMVVGLGFIRSLLFTVLVLLGMQGVVWWIFDSSENIALMFMSIALYTGYQAFENRTSERLLTPIFWVSVLLMSLSKESFIFILPFFAILFRKKKAVGISLMVICLVELLYIKLFIGTTFGYAGVDESTYNLLNISKVIAQYMIRGYGIPLVSVVTFLSYQNRKKLKEFWLDNKFNLIIIVVGILPFLLLYAKSGLNVGRYLLPLLLPQLYVLFRLTAQLSSLTSRWAIIAITSVFFIYHAVKFTKLQREFVAENKYVQAFRNEITKQTDENDSILVLANPVEDFEKAGALMIYLASENALDRKNAKLEIIDLDTYSDTDTHPVYDEFKYKNHQVMNTDSIKKYKKWLVLNEKVMSEITSQDLLKAPHKLTNKGNYSIIIFN